MPKLALDLIGLREGCQMMLWRVRFMGIILGFLLGKLVDYVYEGMPVNRVAVVNMIAFNVVVSILVAVIVLMFSSAYLSRETAKTLFVSVAVGAWVLGIFFRLALAIVHRREHV